jgi:hypothetical protein
MRSSTNCCASETLASVGTGTPNSVPWRFLPKERAVQFQAADYAAWKYRIVLQNARKPNFPLNGVARLLETLGLPDRNSSKLYWI